MFHYKLFVFFLCLIFISGISIDFDLFYSQHPEVIKADKYISNYWSSWLTIEMFFFILIIKAPAIVFLYFLNVKCLLLVCQL